MIAAVVFLAAYAVPILYPDLPNWLLDLCRALSWITWGIFVVDIVVRLFLADERLRYLAQHSYDVVVLALPLLRPLRLLRLIPLLSALNWRARVTRRGRVAVYIAGGASLRPIARSTMSSSARSSCSFIESKVLSMAVVAPQGDVLIARRICRLLDRRERQEAARRQPSLSVGRVPKP